MGSTIAEPQTHRQAKHLSSSTVMTVWRCVKRAPLTYSWLVLWLVTTIIQHVVGALVVFGVSLAVKRDFT
jgi:hypothetical protein